MIYFFSDVHLGLFPREEDKKREQKLLDFFDRIKVDCTKLIIVGDLFDYWFEYKTVIPKYFFRTITKLFELRKQGIEIEYIMGNHDFGHKDFFEKELDIKIHKDDIEREFDGKKFYISHGDGKSNKDTGYKILKKILRAPLSLYLFLKLHPDFGIGIASGSSQKSRVYTDKKNYGKTDGMRDFAFKKIEEGFDFVIMGHRHKAEVTNHKNGTYINLGEWINKPHYGTFINGKFKLHEL
jgi:UDP-2,3-diacylglucosamine hydrolase